MIFGQFLPNANHRTAIATVSIWLGLNGVEITSDPGFEQAASVYVKKSKADIERAYGRAALLFGEKRTGYLWESY